MPQRQFANQKALVAYAEQSDLAYEYEYTPAFAKRQRLLSPEQHEIAEVRTSRGVSRVMLFSKAIVQAEWEANAPLREAMAIKRERLRALRAKRADRAGGQAAFKFKLMDVRATRHGRGSRRMRSPTPRERLVIALIFHRSR